MRFVMNNYELKITNYDYKKNNNKRITNNDCKPATNN